MFLLNLFLSFGLFISSLVIKTLLLNVIILVLIETQVFKTANFFSNSPFKFFPQSITETFIVKPFIRPINISLRWFIKNI